MERFEHGTASEAKKKGGTQRGGEYLCLLLETSFRPLLKRQCWSLISTHQILFRSQHRLQRGGGSVWGKEEFGARWAFLIWWQEKEKKNNNKKQKIKRTRKMHQHRERITAWNNKTGDAGLSVGDDVVLRALYRREEPRATSKESNNNKEKKIWQIKKIRKEDISLDRYHSWKSSCPCRSTKKT